MYCYRTHIGNGGRFGLFRFLASSLTDPAPDPAVEAARRRIDPLKRNLDEADHYEGDRDLTRAEPKQ